MPAKLLSFDDVQFIRGASNYTKAAKEIGIKTAKALTIRKAKTLRGALAAAKVPLDGLPPEVLENLDAADAALNVAPAAEPGADGQKPGRNGSSTIGEPLDDLVGDGASWTRENSENTPVGAAGAEGANAGQNGGQITIVTQPPSAPKPPPKPDPRRTPNFSEATRLYLTSPVFVMPNTPDMYISYMCALKKGFTGTPASWFSIVARDYWEGRKVNMFQEVSGYVPSNDALQSVGPNGAGSGAVESDGSEDSAYE